MIINNIPKRIELAKSNLQDDLELFEDLIVAHKRNYDHISVAAKNIAETKDYITYLESQNENNT